MKFDEYFATTRGRGVLATAAADGKVDAAGKRRAKTGPAPGNPAGRGA
ncbi:hypothetical protein ACHHRT_03815 [Desulfurivibrio sp. D14AmB]